MCSSSRFVALPPRSQPPPPLLLLLLLSHTMQGLNLLLLGNQGKGSTGNCSFSTIEIAIYTDASNAPGTKVYGARLRLGQAGKNDSRSFRYWGNYSSVISMDIVDKSGANSSSNPPAVLLVYSTVYWLRVQVAAAYGAAK
jgi:hypothetical protein